MGGLILHGLEGRKGFNLVETGPACLDAFFYSVRAD
jgi:hypothetical protein